jgi:hypothetical protein
MCPRQEEEQEQEQQQQSKTIIKIAYMCNLLQKILQSTHNDQFDDHIHLGCCMYHLQGNYVL